MTAHSMSKRQNKRGPKPPLGLEQPLLCEARDVAAGDDQVIENPDVDECQRILQARGDQLVGLAWFGDAARVVVREDDCGGVVLQGFLNDFARVDACAVDRAAEELLTGDEPVTVVEVDQGEDFVLAIGEFCHQEVPRGFRALHRGALPHAVAQCAARAVHDFFEARFAIAAVGVGGEKGFVHRSLRSLRPGLGPFAARQGPKRGSRRDHAAHRPKPRRPEAFLLILESTWSDSLLARDVL
jgi:hypothetical protein